MKHRHYFNVDKLLFEGILARGAYGAAVTNAGDAVLHGTARYL